MKCAASPPGLSAPLPTFLSLFGIMPAVAANIDNAEMLNTQVLAAGNTFRFCGLVLDDNGRLRIDCAQVSDGVAFTPPRPRMRPVIRRAARCAPFEASVHGDCPRYSRP
jgi:hypothetical protein